MKTLQWQVLSPAFVLGLLLTATAQSDTTSTNPPPALAADTNAVNPQAVSPPAPADQTAQIEAAVRKAVKAQMAAQQVTPSVAEVDALVKKVMDELRAADNGRPPAANAEAIEPPAQAARQAPVRTGVSTDLSKLVAAGALPAVSTNATGTQGLQLNFNNARLQDVLEYLSDAAGLTIKAGRGVVLSGRVTVIAKQPVSREKAVTILNDALTENGYGAVLQDDGILEIDTAENISRGFGRILKSSNPDEIPNTDALVTQILPIKNVDAAQLIQTLQPILPQGMTLQASAGANAIVVQDTQSHIHRMAEIIKALDSPLAAAATVRVYMLTNADAKSVATVIQSLFQPQGGRGGVGVAAFGAPGGGFNPAAAFFGGGGGGRGGRGGGGGGANNNNGRVTTPTLVAASEDRANALVVSGTEEQLDIVEKVIAELDIVVDDITMVRVFKLNYADPQDMANQLATLFPNTTTTQQQGGGRGGGGFQFGFGRGGGANATATPSGRAMKQSQVTAVPDYRTSSIIVVASRTLMPQIEAMIDQLDSDNSGEQKVYVFPVEGMDPAVMQQLLQSLIPATSGTGTRTTTTGQGNNMFNRSTTGAGTQNRGTGVGVGTGAAVAVAAALAAASAADLTIDC